MLGQLMAVFLALDENVVHIQRGFENNKNIFEHAHIKSEMPRLSKKQLKKLKKRANKGT
jgi:hypothetical protein